MRLLIITIICLCMSACFKSKIEDNQSNRQMYSWEVAKTVANSNYDTIVANAAKTGSMAVISHIQLKYGKNLTTEQIAEVEKKFLTSFKDVYPLEDWIPIFADVYQKIFTAQELHDIAEFTKTPIFSTFASKQKDIYEAISKEEIALTKRKEEAFQKAFVASLEGSNILETISEPHFMKLDPIVANLAPSGNKDQYVQIVVALEINQGIERLIGENLPAIRNKIVLLLSSKTYDELYSRQGKEALADQIRKTINDHLQGSYSIKTPVKNVLFSSFIIQ